VIRFRHGPLATVVSSWVDAANPVTLEIRGTEGVVQVEDGVVRTFGFEWEPTPAPFAVDPGAALAVFVDAVRNGDPQSAGIISPRIAALSTQIVDACYQGAREGRWVLME
jgi:predicted dehydrogenase